MDSKNWHKINTILDRVLDLSEDERTTVILAETRNDPELREEILHLFRADIQASPVLEEGVNAFLTRDKTLPELLDSLKWEQPSLNRYKIIGELGSGGMSIVYLAERTDGVFEKQVAVKVMKPFGLNRHERARRLEEERRILARLNHPNIAGIYDGGLTDAGWPYLVMEQVDGVPITNWGELNRASLQERLQLFGQVCRAVHYAHQQLVVHRDLKPGNILVTKEGEVKLLDFGIARMLQEDDESPVLTRTGQPILTPGYAAPEQFRGNAASTSVDVYSLGVLLYELLTGTRPFDFSGKSAAEIERMVCEQDPVKPSEKTNQVKRSVRLLKPDRSRDDLDIICLKALRKEPNERYGSVQELNDDLVRYRHGQPITARPATMGYRTRKFVQRHKVGVTITAIFLIVVAGFITAMMHQQAVTLQERDRAVTEAQRAEMVTDFLVDLFEIADPFSESESPVEIEELLEKGVEKAMAPGLESDLQLNFLDILSRIYHRTGNYGKSSEIIEQALEVAERQADPDLVMAGNLQSRLALNHRITGNLTVADSLYKEALKNHRKALGEEHPLTLQSMYDWAASQAFVSRDTDLADSLFQDVLERRRRVLDPHDEQLALSMTNLGYIKLRKQEFFEALELYTEALEIYEFIYGEAHPRTFRPLSSIAFAHHRLGNTNLAVEITETLITDQQKAFGTEHPDVAVSWHYLSDFLKDQGLYHRAALAVDTAIQIMENLDTPHQMLPDMLADRARLYRLSDYPEKAGDTWHLAAESCFEIRGDHSPGCINISRSAGEFFVEQRMADEAIRYLQRAREVLNQSRIPRHDELARVEELLEMVKDG